MNYADRVAKASFWVFLIGILSTAVGYLLRIYLARMLSVSDFGLFYAVLALITFFWLFKDMGIGSAIAKFIPEFLVKKSYNRIKKMIKLSILFQFVTGFIILLFLLLSADFLALNFFHTTAAKPVIQILAVEFFISIPILRYLLQGFQKMKAFGLFELSRIAFVLVLVLIFRPLKLTSLALSYLLASVLVQFIFGFYVFSSTRKTLNQPDSENIKSSAIFRKILNFGIVVFIGGIAGTLISYTDTLVITFMRSTYEVGLYQVAMPTSQILWVFITALSAVLLPVFSEIWTKKQTDILSRGFSLLIKFSFVFMIPIALIMLTFPEIIINTLFLSEYLPASPALQILSIAAVSYTLMMICSTIFTAIGKPKINTKTIITLAIFNLISNIILVPIIGIIGAAITTFITYSTGFFILSSKLKNYIQINIEWKNIFKTFCIGLISLTLLTTLKTILYIKNPITEAVICLLIVFIFYAVLILRTGTITRNDILVFKNMEIYIPKRLINIIFRLAK